MFRTKHIGLLLLLIGLFSLRAEGRSRVFKWTMVTDPYHNYIYPEQTGLQYNLSYLYIVESKSLRKYLNRNFDVRASASIMRILKDVATGVYFERYFECRVKHLHSSDTLQVKIIYANGDTIVEKFRGGRKLKFNLHLTKYKNQYDFAAGRSKDDKKRGLVTNVDMTVLSPHRNRGYVMISTKLYTEADMPGILSSIKGKDIIR